MASLQGFDANKVEPNQGFVAIPAGTYRAIVDQSGMKATKDKAGSYLQLRFQVIEGEHKGTRIFCNLNLQNKSTQAVQIAQGQLSAICRAVNVMTPADSQDLHRIPLDIVVTCRKRTDNGEMANDIKAFKPKEDAKAPVASGAPGVSGSLPPWEVPPAESPANA